MKTKSVILIALMAMSVSVMASNEPSVSKVAVLNQKPGVFKVIYESAKAGRVTLKITDKSGVVVFSETMKSVSGFIRPVNFEGMQPGTYFVTIVDESGEVVSEIDYSTKSAITARVSKLNEEGKYLLAVSSESGNEINVKIYDGENNLVHNENVAVQNNLGLLYNLKQVAGTPTFEVTDMAGNSLVK